ncbi:hypothetical protein N7539_006994 [Penicillium diatomitis]|uniref:Uncharacterized protein n=1 Tax=Penicillium diatomitis TaxID=2819901 RepID=A0A9X0BSG3_9EURO|nr:uncharacterized protein N7539_006994 [Penicillium diatomitis]KAJ5481100.1 hypothetical protein N7539_006994 [Penicillium diatomitis]
MTSDPTITLFGEKRLKNVNSLLVWSDKLSQFDPDHQEAVRFLHGLEADFDQLRQATAYEQTSPCFPLKCQIITHTIQDAIDILRRQTLFSSDEVGQVLKMIAHHIGRLSLSKQQGVDLYAEHMDRMTRKIDASWKSRKLRAPQPQAENERRQEKLQEIWDRLHFALPDCACLQCSRES